MLLYSIHVTYVCGKNELLGQALAMRRIAIQLSEEERKGVGTLKSTSESAQNGQKPVLLNLPTP